MAIKDFKVDTGISIDGVTIDVSSNASSGGLVYDSTSSSFVSSVGNIPVGVVRLWASSSVDASPPEDYLICDGRQNLDQDDYASLYAVIGDRFTSSPNVDTFGLPSFNNKTTGTYPIAVGHDKVGDLDSPQVKPMPTTKSIGDSASTAHYHTSGPSFATTAQSTTTPNHSHTLSNVSSNHGHNATTNADGSHNHSTTNASSAHAHFYQAGGTSVPQSPDANANHNHTGYGPKQEHFHGDGGNFGVSTSNTHGHGNTTARVNSDGIVDDHSHNVSVSLDAVTANHNHTMNSSGFYFIIRYR